jgi:mercuric ion binding protein
MNFTKSLLALAVSGMLFASCKDAGSAPKTEGHEVATTEKAAINPEKLETASFNIEGMTCSIGCAKTIEKELAQTKGVQNATVDFDKKTATVEFDSSLQTPENLVKIVEATADGKTYKVSNVNASKNHAMLLDQEKEKKNEKKSVKTEEKKEAKGGCCAGKKKSHCSSDEKKA